MKQELKFNGYTAQPSDYECQDGDLAAVLNLMPEKGSLRPVSRPYVNSSFDEENVIYIHGGRYILYNITDKNVTWCMNMYQTRYDLTTISENLKKPIQVTSIGNTLILLFSSEMRYFLWMEESSSYLSLGSQIPETVLSFGLQGQVIDKDDYDTGHISLNQSMSITGDIPDADVDQITNAVLAKVNKFIADEATNVGKFVMPFFVRYAFRLYDGTLTRQSAPILMIAASDTTPIAVMSFSHYVQDAYNEFGFKVIGVTHKLDYAVRSQAQINAIKNWKDIVRSIDIFVSAPLYKYDQSGKCKAIESFSESGWYCVCKHTAQASRFSQSTYPLRYQKNTLYRLREQQVEDNIVHHDEYLRRVVLPQLTSDAFDEKVKSCSTFYFLKSIPLDELATSRTIIEIPDDYLQSLVTRESLPDDYDSHDKLIARYAFPYNSRLNITNMSKELFRGFEPLCSLNYTDGYAYDVAHVTQNPLEHDTPETLRCFVYIHQDGKDIIVESVTGTIAEYAPILYFYYPNPKAYKALFVRGSSKFEIPLTGHPLLNGAVYFAGWTGLTETPSATVPTASSSRKIEIRNKIYTSEVNNPFLFPLLAINTVSSGQVIGLASAAKALSEGQFGQFPMYAFTNDGVWALEVSAQTGAFSARQPITRDVCINPDSITQIDSAVLFATNRGIMMIAGSQAVCISDVMNNNEEPFDFTAMPLSANIEALLGLSSGSGSGSGSGSDSSDDVFPEQPFTKEFLSECQMLYSYNRQIIIVFNANFGYAYIYSLESKQWGMMKSDLISKVDSYPRAYVMTSRAYRLVDYSRYHLGNNDAVTVLSPQFLITRPLKLDPALKDVHKTIDNIIVRGNFVKGHVKVVLYGSRDIRTWFPIATSVDHYLRGFSGTPYKYFRIALICNLTHDESIWGCSIQYTPRLVNQPR